MLQHFRKHQVAFCGMVHVHVMAPGDRGIYPNTSLNRRQLRSLFLTVISTCTTLQRLVPIRTQTQGFGKHNYR